MMYTRACHEFKDSYPCRLPGQVHEILVRHNAIADPVITHCGKESQEVSKSDWIYRAEFQLSQDADRYLLRCGGLDTIVDIYLNGKKIGEHKDMFFPFCTEIVPDMKKNNVLLFHFHSPVQYLEKMKKEHADTSINPAHYIRKAPHDFEDFLGLKPYFAGVGIFAPVTIDLQKYGVIEDFHIEYELNETMSHADITAEVNGQLFTEQAGTIEVIIREEKSALICHTRQKLCLTPSSGNRYTVTFNLRHIPVRLWWPLGYGDQVLYECEARLVIRDIVIKCMKRTGFRKVDFKGSFDVRVNGIPVRLWGANLVPVDGITHCYNPEKTALLFKRITDANMNFIRLWGGGEPYPDEIWQLADENGVLLWSEFFHKWGMYPQDEESMKLYREEALYLLTSFRHHPSLIMWCGGNECYMGAEMDNPSCPYIGDKIFEEYEKLCRELDPKRYFQKNSPFGGDFTNDPRAGDFHGWNHLWYIPYTDYPVMFSENSRVSPPVLKSLKKYIPDPEEFWPKGFRSVLYSSAGNLLPPSWMKLKTGPEPYWCSPIEKFYDADTPEALIYRCQAAHAQMMKQIGERLKRGRPVWKKDQNHICKGQLIWKLNDSWPQIFCGLLDYDLNGGIPYYTVCRVFQQIQVSFAIEDNITIWGVNDSRHSFRGSMEFILFNPVKNEIIHQFTKEIVIKCGCSVPICNLDCIPQFKRENILYACLRDTDGRIAARNYDFVEIERNICFPDAKLTLNQNGGGIDITSDKFARCIELSGTGSSDDVPFFFEDNYFDLMPFEKRHIAIECKEKEYVITAKAFYSSTSETIQIQTI